MHYRLHRYRHQARREKHAQRVLEGERKIFVGFVVVVLQMGEVVQNWPHYEFVEQHDAYQSAPRDYARNGQFQLGVRVIGADPLRSHTQLLGLPG